jgi:hypothetical protein
MHDCKAGLGVSPVFVARPAWESCFFKYSEQSGETEHVVDALSFHGDRTTVHFEQARDKRGYSFGLQLRLTTYQLMRLFSTC